MEAVVTPRLTELTHSAIPGVVSVLVASQAVLVTGCRSAAMLVRE